MTPTRVALALFLYTLVHRETEFGDHYELGCLFYELTVEGTEEMARRAKEIVVNKTGDELRSAIGKLYAEFRAYPGALKEAAVHSV